MRPDLSLLRLTGTVGAGPKYGLTRSESGNPPVSVHPLGMSTPGPTRTLALIYRAASLRLYQYLQLANRLLKLPAGFVG